MKIEDVPENLQLEITRKLLKEQPENVIIPFVLGNLGQLCVETNGNLKASQEITLESITYKITMNVTFKKLKQQVIKLS